MTETVIGNREALKRNLRLYEDRVEKAYSRKLQASSTTMGSPIVDGVRNVQNPTKQRAERRAKELGKSLAQVYAEAGVNKAYLTEEPKTGWRQDRLRAIARALDWQVHELTDGNEGVVRKPRTAAKPATIREMAPANELLETAITTVTDMIRDLRIRPQVPSAQFARLTSQLYEMLRKIVESGEQLPSQAALTLLVRSLMSLIMDLSRTRDTR
jgi:DNA-binding transcriptional regulator YiaG